MQRRSKMNYKVRTLKKVDNELVIIERAKNTTAGAPCFNVTVIIAGRGAYNFKKKGYYQGEEDLAKEAVRNIKEELGI